jgi:molecular chaperone HscB
VLQPLPEVTHFEALGIPPRQELASEEIERAFRTRSKQVHPDRFAGASAIERRLALLHTTAVNDAYQVLRSPVRRAEYLLKLRGHDLSSESHRTEDPTLLLEMMELRERLDGASGAQLEAIDAELDDGVREQLEAAADFFDRGQGELTEIARRMERVRYLERLREQVETGRAAEEAEH